MSSLDATFEEWLPVEEADAVESDGETTATAGPSRRARKRVDADKRSKRLETQSSASKGPAKAPAKAPSSPLVTLTNRLRSTRFSVLHVPMKRRKETFWTALWLFSVPFFPLIIMALSVVLLLWWPTSLLMAGYLGWILFIDRAPKLGSRRKVLSGLRIWGHVRDYFPISLVKTAELSPDRSYLFGCHPHGVISMGAFVNFATTATGVGELFPGIDIHLTTLATNFKWPFLREWLLHMGIVDVSRDTCHNILSRGKGSCVLIATGGAEESLDAFPGVYHLTLLNRKGFVRVALRAGASLVPVMSFGENELWNALPNPDGSRIRAFQEMMKRTLKFTFPIIYGRGVFNYDFGLMPHRRPIVSVVGRPIDVEGPIDVSTEEGRRRVDEVHALYIARVRELFEEHKGKLPSTKDVELVIK